MLAVLLPLAVLGGGCKQSLQTEGRTAAQDPHSGPVDPLPVGQAEFAAKAQLALGTRAMDTQQRRLVAGVVRQQLTRAQARFESGATEAGLAALTGALFLLRAGEHQPEIFRGYEGALSAAAAEVARTGNEGRALALYSILGQLLPEGPERRDVREHLAALSRWLEAQKSAGPIQAAVARHRTALDRALFEASWASLHEANAATVAWINAALSLDPTTLQISSPAEREQAVQAYRAIRAGGGTLVALYLRHGDATGALKAIDNRTLERIVPPQLTERLERAEEGDSQAWFDLFMLFEQAASSETPEMAIDAQVAQAASWGAAVELYRNAPGETRNAMPLAEKLESLGFAEVAPRVLAQTLDKDSDPEAVSWGMALTLRAMLSENELGQLDGARRAYREAAPIVRLARSRQLVRRVRPSAARLQYVMGALELEGANLDRARPLLQAAFDQDPQNISSLRQVAAIDRQRGKEGEALKVLSEVAALARAQADHGTVTEVLLSSYEIYRDRNEVPNSASALRSALEAALQARGAARTRAELANAERLLARVLDHYGNRQGAERAIERAYEASRSDVAELSTTVLDASRRALTLRDLRGAREAVRRALDAGLAGEDLVYVALWLRLLEMQLNESSDGTTEEALAAVESDRRWPSVLRAWGQGKVDGQGLLAAARNQVERTEALFYAGMTESSPAQARASLEQVAKSQAISLLEVMIAKDLLAVQVTKGAPSLPPDVELP